MSRDNPNADSSAHDDDQPAPISRRRAIGLGGAAIIGASLGTDLGAELVRPAASAARTPRHRQASATAVLEALRPEIQPRSAWGADLPVVGDIVAETDVRFLLIHHTASTNSYTPDEVIPQIRDFYRLHTSPEKGWPDVAYNFFVDRFGTIWEARSGSIEGAVRGDATGGSQGFAMLCSLIGNHAEEEITAEAAESLVRLLAWLGERHAVETAPGTTVDFVSRGSNRWPEGAVVTAATISGHRDMSQTVCPGDFAYNLLPEVIPLQVTARRTEALAAAGPEPTTPTTVAVVPNTEAAEPEVDAAGPGTTEILNDEGVLDAAGQPAATEGQDDGPIPRSAVLVGVAATAVAMIAAGAARIRGRVPGSGSAR